ncbi:MAG: deaminase [Gemmatimonadetes bacterium RIFCSPLOWO2_02_FULL_71_11]|nr:MAG: deaminase [Gemmatimonadetes bacterium RIFCSPLOWO2_02_FULL_71_11]
MADLKSVATGKAPKAIGPYSQAVIANGFLYSAGQIALDPATMVLVGTDVTAQTERVLRNLEAILHEAGSSLGRVVKTTVFLADMGDFAAMNEVYAKHFGEHRPARSTVAAKTLPKNALVEIDVVALV